MSAIAYVPELYHPDPDALPPSTGGSESGVAEDYSGGEPTFTPTTEGVHAIDTSTGQIWWFFNGVWN